LRAPPLRQALDASLHAPAPRHTHDRNPERPLRIGFVSGDLRQHAVAHFMEPMFEALGQRGLSLVAYSNLAREDGTSARLRGLIPTWHRVAALSDTELAAQIRADRIDILADLSGHTADNRLPVFALRPAPVQVTWLGYPAPPACAASTTASSTLTAPPGRLDDQFTEKLVHLPYAMSFKTDPDAPDVGPLPALARGHFTFGSLNRPNKISAECIALWARVLKAVPDARLLVGAVSEAATAERLLAQFAAAGIGPSAWTCARACPPATTWPCTTRSTCSSTPFPTPAAPPPTTPCGWACPPSPWPAAPWPSAWARASWARWGSPTGWRKRRRVRGHRPAGRRAPGRTRPPAPEPARAPDALPNLSTARVADSVALAFRLMWRGWCAGQAPAPIILPRFDE
jgi:hypothetical protein